MTIQNLQSEVGKKLNGNVGKVLTEQVDAEGRHQVQVDGISSGIKLMKEENLEPVAEADLVRVYRLACDGARARHETLVFPKRHSLFHNEHTPQGNSPVMALCGFPLIVRKTKPRSNTLRDQADYDNQWATWMKIDPNDGFSPPDCQSFVGPVYVYHPNGEADVTGDDVDVMNEYFSMLLNGFSNGFNPKRKINPDYFVKFLQGIKSKREESTAGSSLSGLTILNQGAIDREMAAWAASVLWQR